MALLQQGALRARRGRGPASTPMKERTMKQPGIQRQLGKTSPSATTSSPAGCTDLSADDGNLVTLSSMSEQELFTNKEYINSHGPHARCAGSVRARPAFAELATCPSAARLRTFLSMELDIKGPTYVGDTIHVEIELTEIADFRRGPGAPSKRPPTTR